MRANLAAQEATKDANGIATLLVKFAADNLGEDKNIAATSFNVQMEVKKACIKRREAPVLGPQMTRLSKLSKERDRLAKLLGYIPVSLNKQLNIAAIKSKVCPAGTGSPALDLPLQTVRCHLGAPYMHSASSRSAVQSSHAALGTNKVRANPPLPQSINNYEATLAAEQLLLI
jgi:hypothetical protein